MNSRTTRILLAVLFAVVTAGCTYEPVYHDDHYSRYYEPDYNYYFYPKVGVYFHIPTGVYYYRDNGYWRHAHRLPSYIVIDHRHRHPFYYRGKDPYSRYNDHYRKWGKYKDDRRDYRERHDHDHDRRDDRRYKGKDRHDDRRRDNHRDHDHDRRRDDHQPPPPPKDPKHKGGKSHRDDRHH